MIFYYGHLWVHKTSLNPPLFIEVPVPSHEGRGYKYVC
jgi:hypothetical protein